MENALDQCERNLEEDYQKNSDKGHGIFCPVQDDNNAMIQDRTVLFSFIRWQMCLLYFQIFFPLVPQKTCCPTHCFCSCVDIPVLWSLFRCQM